MKTTIIIICIILVLLGIPTVAFYTLKSNLPGIVLSANVYEFNKLDGFSEINLTSVDNESFELITGVDKFDELNSHVVKSLTKSFIVNPTDASMDISVILNGANELELATRLDNTPKLNLSNKDFLFNLFKNKNTWDSIISNQKYTKEETTTDFDIVINPENIINVVNDSLEFYSVNYLELQGSKTFEISKLNVTGLTDPTLIITLNKISKLITKVTLILNSDTFVDFGVSANYLDSTQTSKENIKMKYGKGFQLVNKVNTLKFVSSYKRFQNLQPLDDFAINNISF